jgi:lysophospholipase L1-like esterase
VEQAQSISRITSSITAPCWLKLVRTGTTLTGLISLNGSSFVPLGSMTVALSRQVYIGLAVTSHVSNMLNTAVIDHIAVSKVSSGGTVPGGTGVTTIMPLGDSITYGVDSTNGGGYRTYLWDELVAHGYNVQFVGSQAHGPATIETGNEGHPGYRIDAISRLVVARLEVYRPQIILLHIGTNDILQHASVSYTTTHLSMLINRITDTYPSAMLVVAQIIPLNRSGLDSMVQAFNATIPALVQARDRLGKHVYYVNMYNAVSAKDLVDGIHPDDYGYERMSLVWYHILILLLKK